MTAATDDQLPSRKNTRPGDTTFALPTLERERHFAIGGHIAHARDA